MYKQVKITDSWSKEKKLMSFPKLAKDLYKDLQHGLKTINLWTNLSTNESGQ